MHSRGPCEFLGCCPGPPGHWAWLGVLEGGRFTLFPSPPPEEHFEAFFLMALSQ